MSHRFWTIAINKQLTTLIRNHDLTINNQKLKIIDVINKFPTISEPSVNHWLTMG